MEQDLKSLRREIKSKDDRCLALEKDSARCKDNHGETEILLGALSALQDKNSHLENSLSAETRIKLDLFSALGEAKRQLEIKESEKPEIFISIFLRDYPTLHARKMGEG